MDEGVELGMRWGGCYGIDIGDVGRVGEGEGED